MKENKMKKRKMYAKYKIQKEHILEQNGIKKKTNEIK